MSKEEFKGFVKWYSKEKFYGFITPDNSDISGDIFVHGSDIEWNEAYDEGTKVKFNIEESERGMKAINVKRMGING